MSLNFGETKGCCFVAYDGVAGDQYRFPGGQIWSVTSHWAITITGFKAALITTDSQSVLAFAGTDSAIDVIADLAQLFSVPPQYSQALILAATVRSSAGSNLHLAGHSLGGGLAAYCSAELRIPASTVNPAPLVGAASLISLFAQNPQITNYVARGGEIVSSSPGRNPGTDISVPSTGGVFGFFTDHMLSNVGPSVPLPVKI